MRMYDDKFLIHSLIHDSRDSNFFCQRADQGVDLFWYPQYSMSYHISECIDFV